MAQAAATPNKSSAREALRSRIQARAEAKAATRKAAAAVKKYATLRRIADEEPQEVDTALGQLAEGFSELSQALRSMSQNLDLGGVPATASLKARLAAKRNYGSRFRRLAEEAPDQFELAYGEVYQALDGLAEDMEVAADNLGIELPPPGDGLESEPAAIAEGEHEVVDEAEEVGLDIPPDVEEHVEEEVKEGSGSDWFVTDRGPDGKPKAPTASAKKSVVQARN